MTAKNLFDLTYEVATELGVVTESFATGGSTTTVVDTLYLTQADDYWNLGTVWVIYDAGGSSAAPEGEYGRVTDFDNGTSTATIEAVTAAIGSGDRFAIAHKLFPLNDLITAVNRAIRDVGMVPTADSTSLDTAAQQTEYTLPAAANYDLRQVWIETKLNDSNDHQWALVRDWYVHEQSAGAGDTLFFKSQPQHTRNLKIVYMAVPPKLDVSSDKLHESINYKRVIYRATVHALKHYRTKTKNTDEHLERLIQEYEARATQADLMYPVIAPRRMGQIMSVPYTTTVELAPGENTIP